MAQRTEARDSLDDFPTPPWATRALLEHVINAEPLGELRCLEPACNVGHMSKVLQEYFRTVISSDVFDYGYGSVQDYLDQSFQPQNIDWIITNPPFRLAEEFVAKALNHARRGVAVLTRTVFIESVGRYNRLFEPMPPSIVAQFTERVPMVKGRLDRKASTATGYCWVIWEKTVVGSPRLAWIPPCRKALERPADYDAIPEQSSLSQKATGDLFEPLVVPS